MHCYSSVVYADSFCLNFILMFFQCFKRHAVLSYYIQIQRRGENLWTLSREHDVSSFKIPSANPAKVKEIWVFCLRVLYNNSVQILSVQYPVDFFQNFFVRHKKNCVCLLLMIRMQIFLVLRPWSSGLIQCTLISIVRQAPFKTSASHAGDTSSILVGRILCRAHLFFCG